MGPVPGGGNGCRQVENSSGVRADWGSPGSTRSEPGPKAAIEAGLDRTISLRFGSSAITHRGDGAGHDRIESAGHLNRRQNHR